MQRQPTTTQAPQSGGPDKTDLHFRDQSEPNDGASRADGTTLAFEGHIGISADDDVDVGTDPYNRVGRFRRTVR